MLMIKQIAYSTFKTIVPRSVRRRLLPLVLPKRMVVSHQELGQSIKFVLYPGKQEDYGLIFGHELEARDMLPEIIEPGNIVFDVGAHYGLYTLLFSKLVTDLGQVHSFDPISENIDRLRENVEINALNNVSVNEYAVSNETGVTQINVGNSTKVSSLKNLSDQRKDWRQINTITLDDYWNRLGKPPVQFIKIDVEGAETMVVRGMHSLLKECRPRIILELHLFALDEAERNEIATTLFSEGNYAAKLLYVKDLGGNVHQTPDETFMSWDNIKSYVADAHIAGLYLFQSTAE